MQDGTYLSMVKRLPSRNESLLIRSENSVISISRYLEWGGQAGLQHRGDSHQRSGAFSTADIFPVILSLGAVHHILLLSATSVSSCL